MIDVNTFIAFPVVEIAGLLLTAFPGLPSVSPNHWKLF
jgi:hypothetical protein